MNRKLYLEPLAKKLSIEPSEYKNKTMLTEAIKSKLEAYSNERDPITLINIDQIESEHFVEWEQCGRVFAADARSIKLLLSQGPTINPWAVDFVTSKSCSLERLNSDWSMLNVD